MCSHGGTAPGHSTDITVKRCSPGEVPPCAPLRSAPLCFPLHRPLAARRTCSRLLLTAAQHVRMRLFLNLSEVLQGHQSPFSDLRTSMRSRSVVGKCSPVQRGAKMQSLPQEQLKNSVPPNLLPPQHAPSFLGPRAGPEDRAGQLQVLNQLPFQSGPGQRGGGASQHLHGTPWSQLPPHWLREK